MSSPHAAEVPVKKLAFQRVRRAHTRAFQKQQKQKTRVRPLAAMKQLQFVQLCRRYMTDALDNVATITHMANAHTTIFMVGEKHSVHTKCKSILQMFQQLFRENETHSNPVPIDFMIELLSESVDFYSQYRPIDSRTNKDQMNEVRSVFAYCIEDRNCPFLRVHWTDPTKQSEKNAIPDWLNYLGDPWDNIRNYWQYDKRFEHFNEAEDVDRILLENKMIMKEIKKAGEKNPVFTYDFALKQFLRMDRPQYSGRKRMFFLVRSSMDVYSAARIVNMNMKHVIYYAGYNHTDNLEKILSALDFKLLEKKVNRSPCAPNDPSYPD